MAGAGYKLFNTGDVLTAAQVNTYLMEQTIMVFANATARDTALSGVLAQGMQCFLKDTNTMQYYSGSAWVTLSTGGDITSVTAGTGLSGGGTSGDVTLSLSVPVTEVRGGTNQTTYTTGDLLYASGANTLAKRAIGTTGQVLTVSGGLPTWAAAPSSTPTFVGCLAKGNTQTIATATDTAINFGNADVYDTDNFHDTVTNNSRITIPSGKGGYYLIYGNVTWANNNSNSRIVYLYKNGVRADQVYVYWYGSGASQSYYTQAFSTVVSAAAGDYFQIYVNQASGGNLDVYGDNNLPGLRFGCALLGV